MARHATSPLYNPEFQFPCHPPLKYLLRYIVLESEASLHLGKQTTVPQQMEPCKAFHDEMQLEREANVMLCLGHCVHHKPLGIHV